jgi:hypothetical protein
MEPGVAPVRLNYDPAQQAWLMATESGSQKVAQYEGEGEGDALTLFLADGSTRTLTP